MRNSTAATGIMIIGIVLALIHYVPTTVKDERTKEGLNTWSISAYLEEGESIFLGLTDADIPQNWSYPPYDPEIIKGGKVLSVTIINVPTGKNASFEVFLIPPGGDEPKEPYAYRLTTVNYTETDPIYAENHGGLIVERPVMDVGGVAPNNGTYSVNCSLVPDYLYSNGEEVPAPPPSKLTLHIIAAKTIYPFNFLLPVGITLSFLGLAIMIFSRLQKKRRKHLRKTK